MLVEFVDSLPSTQLFLTDAVRCGAIKPPYGIVASEQTGGIGSRSNEWVGLKGNLFFSFCVDERSLPEDLNPSSVSIYFAGVMREILAQKGSEIWLKWPNDFYVGELKIGGAMTTKIGDCYICGIGMNLLAAPRNFGVLDIQISANELVWAFLELLEKKISWKQIFSKFRIDFQKSKSFITHVNNEQISLRDALLCEDGAILVNDKKVYSLR